jgi:hypothetical protein
VSLRPITRSAGRGEQAASVADALAGGVTG